MHKPANGTLIHGIVTMCMTVGLSYFGYEKYEAHQAQQASPNVEIHVDSKGDSHAHSAVVSQNDINQLIRNAVVDAIQQQDKKNLSTFKKKETWD